MLLFQIKDLSQLDWEPDSFIVYKNGFDLCFFYSTEQRLFCVVFLNNDKEILIEIYTVKLFRPGIIESFPI